MEELLEDLIEAINILEDLKSIYAIYPLEFQLALDRAYREKESIENQ